jgi:hypothetical protein
LRDLQARLWAVPPDKSRGKAAIDLFNNPAVCGQSLANFPPELVQNLKFWESLCLPRIPAGAELPAPACKKNKKKFDKKKKMV